MQIDLYDMVTEEFRLKMQNSFARLTGFGVVFIDKDGNHLDEGGNFTRFCRAINCREDGARCCAQTNLQAIELSLNTGQTCRPSIFVCHAGLVNIEIPIVHEGRCIGAFTAGQVLCEEDCYPRDNLPPPINWLTDPQLAEYYKEIPVLSREHIENTASLMSDLTQYILHNFVYNTMHQTLARQKEELLTYEKRQLELEHLLTQAKFAALQKQVMPHFIFNVLNSVSRLISMKDYDTAQQMLMAFTSMMRYNLSNAQTSVQLGQELEYVRNYLSIQKLRFNTRVQCDIYCDPDMEALEIPFFLLQPLVENALEHGILNQTNGGSVTVHCKKLPTCFNIEVWDDGVGMDEEKLKRLRQIMQEPTVPEAQEDIGLYNCYNRLKLMYGNAAAFEIKSTVGMGTRVTITVDCE